VNSARNQLLTRSRFALDENSVIAGGKLIEKGERIDERLRLTDQIEAGKVLHHGLAYMPPQTVWQRY
jgi:hypothetical protein